LKLSWQCSRCSEEEESQYINYLYINYALFEEAYVNYAAAGSTPHRGSSGYYETDSIVTRSGSCSIARCSLYGGNDIYPATPDVTVPPERGPDCMRKECFHKFIQKTTSIGRVEGGQIPSFKTGYPIPSVSGYLKLL